MMVKMKLVHRLLRAESSAGTQDAATAAAQHTARAEWLSAVTGLDDLTDSSSNGEWREHERNEFHAVAVQPHCLPARALSLQVRAQVD
jgi:hypothetical protein